MEAAAEEAKQRQQKPSDKISVVFCIDHSGSMEECDRLEQCKQALSAQINAMAEEHPDRTVGVVTFERSVSIIGDGVEKPQNVNVDFNNFEALMENGRVEA